MVGLDHLNFMNKRSGRRAEKGEESQSKELLVKVNVMCVINVPSALDGASRKVGGRVERPVAKEEGAGVREEGDRAEGDIGCSGLFTNKGLLFWCWVAVYTSKLEFWQHKPTWLSERFAQLHSLASFPEK